MLHSTDDMVYIQPADVAQIVQGKRGGEPVVRIYLNGMSANALGWIDVNGNIQDVFDELNRAANELESDKKEYFNDKIKTLVMGASGEIGSDSTMIQEA